MELRMIANSKEPNQTRIFFCYMNSNCKIKPTTTKTNLHLFPVEASLFFPKLSLTPQVKHFWPVIAVFHPGSVLFILVSLGITQSETETNTHPTNVRINHRPILFSVG